MHDIKIKFWKDLIGIEKKKYRVTKDKCDKYWGEALH